MRLIGKTHRGSPLLFRAVEQAFAEAPDAGQRLIVAKSFGTFAIPWADAANVPGVWLRTGTGNGGHRGAP